MVLFPSCGRGKNLKKNAAIRRMVMESIDVLFLSSAPPSL